MLSNKNHHSEHFQRAWNRDGSDSFKFEVVEYVDRLEKETDIDFERRLCKTREQHYLDLYGAQEYIRKESYRFLETTYNISPTAGSSLGRIMPEGYVPWNKGKTGHLKKETLEKMGAKRRARVTKLETIEKMSKTMKQVRNKPEVKEKYKQALSKRPLITCPHCRKESYNKGDMTHNHLDNCKQNPSFDQEAFSKKKEETRQKLLEAKKHLKTVTCPHCNHSSRNAGNMKLNHFDNCKVVSPGVRRRPDSWKKAIKDSWIKRKAGKTT